MHTSKLQRNYISHKKTLSILPLQFLEELKKITGPTSWFTKSWSQTSWSWSFQQHILPGFLMTIHQSSILQDPTKSNWEISKISTTISPWPQANTSKGHYKLKYVQQQPKHTTPKYLSGIDFLLNQLLLRDISPSQKIKNLLKWVREKFRNIALNSNNIPF